MIRPPFMARVAAGVAVTAYEETLKLPATLVTLPMTAVSHLLQTTMRVQQSINTLAIKGDRLFELLSWSKQEQPEWAVFDEDVDTDGEVDVPDHDGPTAPGRFALYSSPPEAGATSPETGIASTDTTADTRLPENATTAPAQGTAPRPAPATENAVAVPDIAESLDYGSLTLAQLRARLRTLSVENLTALLAYENATRARAPFVTMLTNRITTASAK